MIPAVRHVLLARPNQLHRRAGNLLGDRHGLLHEIVGRAPAEAAAERHLVNVAFGNRQAGGFGGRGQRGLAVLRRRPYLAAIRRVHGGRVHRLHSRVILIRKGVDGLYLLHRAGDRLPSIAVLVADKRLLASRPLLSNSAMEALETFALSPSSQLRGNASRAVFACHQRSATTATADSPTLRMCLTPFWPWIFAASKLTSLPPKTGQSLIAAQSIPGSFTSNP